MTPFEKLCKSLEAKIVACYEEGVTLDEAEKLAAQFLYAMLQVSDELKAQDLSARMRKSGLKAVKAAVYTESAKPSSEGKRPTEAALAALVDSHEVVQGEQEALDVAEVNRDSLERYYNVFREAHLFTRGVSKGRFDG